ncbi:two-component regulator propeller domain-containing protein [Hyalangium versicolor]|uniref:two-component regulator propeller domain-containing protein n=1 Tax=Hyalangium versicolor TaxID=2861190 RepID=UPI001CCE0D1B|nr:two-component regulator propeller domain-containing protein [Hyalangium versicolor]
MPPASRSHLRAPPSDPAAGRRSRCVFATVLLVGLLGGALPASALDPDKSLVQFPHRVWQTTDGLPENAIEALAQTPDGYLWSGTWEGLVRFDGVHFTVFDLINTPALQGRTIRCLATDPAGTLWIGTDVGLTRMSQGIFSAVNAAPEVPLRHLHALLPTRDGSLWIATDGHGLLRYSEGRFQVWTTDTGLAHNRVGALVEDPKGRLWVGTPKGLQFWDGTALQPGPSLPEQANASVLSLAAEKDGTLWIGTEDGTVYQLRDQRLRPVPEASLPGSPVGALFVDRLNTLWVGSTGLGMLRLAQGRRFTFDVTQGLVSNTVIAFLEDLEGNLWIGASEGGLHRFKDAPFTSMGRPEGLPQEVVTAIYEARDGSLWFAGLGSGVTRWQDGKMTTWTTRDGLIHDRVRSITEAPDGSIWFATQTGLSRWERGAITLSLSHAQGLPSGAVRVAYFDREGSLWAGTQEGLARWNGEQFELLTRAQGLPGNSITLLKKRKAGGFWVGTAEGGLAYFLKGRLVLVADEGRPMFSEVQALQEEPDGVLWIGTDEGLYRWKQDNFQRFSRSEGLFNDRIFEILPDGHGNLWMSCNKGIFRVSQAELEAVADGQLSHLTSEAYGTDEGMRAEECNGIGMPAGIVSRDGRLWFPTIRGVVVYDPNKPWQTQALPAPSVLIEDLLINSRSVPLAVERPIPVGEGRVEIHYTATSLRAPQQLTFRYRLEGVDADWVEAGSRREAYYTHLAPGHYRFHVEVASPHEGFTPSEATLLFSLEPRFYQTWSFRVACGLLTALVVAGTVWLRILRVRRRERQLQARVDERTAELATVNGDLKARIQELQATRERLIHAEKMAAVGTLAAGVGHEINNPLAYIISNLHYATSEVRGAAQREGPQAGWGEVEQALDEALQGADRVKRIVQDLKTFSRMQPERLRRVDLHGVMELALSIADAEIRHRARVVKEYDEGLEVLGDETRLGQVFLNLLVNAAQAIPEGHADQHEIRITLRTNERGHILAAVSDTGSGIPPEVLPRIFEPFFTTKPVGVGTGLGLSICHSYIQNMGGEIRVRSEQGKGTTFEVELPPAPKDPSGAHTILPAVGPSSPARGRLLIIDDEPLLITALSRTLEPDHEVVSFTSARLALEQLRAGERYALILCDLMMPEMTGMELHETLRHEAPEMAERMVFLTGGAFTEAARTFLDSTHLPWLEKPFEPEPLRARLRVLLTELGQPSKAPAA